MQIACLQRNLSVFKCLWRIQSIWCLMRLTYFCGFETVSALQSKSVKRPSQNNEVWINQCWLSSQFTSRLDLKWIEMENEIKFPCRSHHLVSVAGTNVNISERNVKHHHILAGRLPKSASQLSLAKVREKNNFHSISSLTNFRLSHSCWRAISLKTQTDWILFGAWLIRIRFQEN